MKKTLLIALMAIVATTTVTAQDIEQRGDRRGHDPEKRVEGQVKRLDKKLKLSLGKTCVLIEAVKGCNITCDIKTRGQRI